MRVPDPGLGAGNPRAYEMILAIKKLGYQLTVYPHTVKTLPENLKNEYQKAGVEIIKEEEDLFAPQNKNRYHIVIVSRPDVFAAVRVRMREHFPKAALIYDAEALFSAREILKHRLFGNEKAEQEAEKGLAGELRLAGKADYVISVSSKEMKKIKEGAGIRNISIWGQALDPSDTNPDFSGRAGMFFVGGYLEPGSPNEHAITRFAGSIMPKLGGCAGTLRIAGMDPCDSIRALSSSSVKVLGYVPDLLPEYENARLFVVPHLFSAGIPAKLLEAMSFGLPAVISRHIADQMEIKEEEMFLIADDDAMFASKILRLYGDEALWHRLRRNALFFIRENYSAEKMTRRLGKIFHAALAVRRQRKIRTAFGLLLKAAGLGRKEQHG